MEENKRLQKEIKLLTLQSSNLQHEMITPLKCIIHIMSKLQSNKKIDKLVLSEIEVVINTA